MTFMPKPGKDSKKVCSCFPQRLPLLTRALPLGKWTTFTNCKCKPGGFTLLNCKAKIFQSLFVGRRLREMSCQKVRTLYLASGFLHQETTGTITLWPISLCLVTEKMAGINLPFVP